MISIIINFSSNTSKFNYTTSIDCASLFQPHDTSYDTPKIMINEKMFPNSSDDYE